MIELFKQWKPTEHKKLCLSDFCFLGTGLEIMTSVQLQVQPSFQPQIKKKTSISLFLELVFDWLESFEHKDHRNCGLQAANRYVSPTHWKTVNYSSPVSELRLMLALM